MKTSLLAIFTKNLPNDLRPGVFRYVSLADGGPSVIGAMIFRCPGCAAVKTVGFQRPTRREDAPMAWDGNRLAPTLSGALTHGCGWQGTLTGGRWMPR